MTAPRPQFFYFDLGNVLYTFDYSLSASQAAAIVGVDKAVLREAIYDFGLEELYETGFVSSSRFAAEIARSVGTTFDAAEFLEAVSLMFTFNRPILRLIARLQELQIPAGILSNTCEAHWKWLVRQSTLDIPETFAPCVLSYEVGCMKPHEAIYAAAEQVAGVPPDRIMFIDDRAVNVVAARHRSWNAVLFESVEQILALPELS